MQHDDTDSRPSRTALKREAEELQAFGERLVSLPEATLARLPLPEKLLEAVQVARGLGQRGALRRQRQYIGRLMREMDVAEVRRAIEALDREHADEQATFHAAERWRERLLGGDAADLEAFFDAHPHADRQHIRHLLKAAQAETAAGKPPRQRRELFREIRQVLESGV